MTTRRNFVKTMAAATAVGPTILGAADKAGTALPVIGTGEHTYECHHLWGHDSLPDNHKYGHTSNGAAVDKAGNLYVTHHGGPDSIFVFDASGKFIRSMGKEFMVKGSGSGHGVDIREEDGTEYLYLAPDHTSLAFTKTTLTGEIVWHKGKTELTKDSGIKLGRYRPTNSSFRPDGGVYLGDGYGSHYVFEYDKDGKFVRALGGPGKDKGKFNTPHGQWLDERGDEPLLIVVDRAKKRLAWFDMDGKFVKELGGFVKPADADIQGDVLMVPDVGAQVSLFDKDNKLIVHLGHDATWQADCMNRKKGIRDKPQLWQAGKFIHPHDACFDADGNIFVTEYVKTGRVTKLRKVGA